MDTPPTATPVDQPWTPVLPEVYLEEGLRIRELPPEEWHRLSEAGGFFAEGTHIPAPKANARIVVAEAQVPDGPDRLDRLVWKVIAYCPAFDAVHLEPLHIHEDFRNHPKLARAFLGGLILLLQNLDIQHVWATIADGQPGATSIIEKLGFIPLPGKVWTGRIPPKVEG